MGTVITKSPYTEPMKIRFQSRRVLTRTMAFAICRAFIGSAAARVSGLHDFGLDMPVRFLHPDDAFAIAMAQLPKHVIVCTDRGGECILSLYSSLTHYECIVSSGSGFQELIAMHVGPHYTEYALRETGWLDEFNVPGLDTLHSDVDGEFAGVLVSGGTISIDDSILDTTAGYRVDYAPELADESMLAPQSSAANLGVSDNDEFEFMRQFQHEILRMTQQPMVGEKA